jgi:hypothetical protein
VKNFRAMLFALALVAGGSVKAAGLSYDQSVLKQLQRAGVDVADLPSFIKSLDIHGIVSFLESQTQYSSPDLGSFVTGSLKYLSPALVGALISHLVDHKLHDANKQDLHSITTMVNDKVTMLKSVSRFIASDKHAFSYFIQSLAGLSPSLQEGFLSSLMNIPAPEARVLEQVVSTLNMLPRSSLDDIAGIYGAMASVALSKYEAVQKIVNNLSSQPSAETIKNLYTAMNRIKSDVLAVAMKRNLQSTIDTFTKNHAQDLRAMFETVKSHVPKTTTNSTMKATEQAVSELGAVITKQVQKVSQTTAKSGKAARKALKSAKSTTNTVLSDLEAVSDQADTTVRSWNMRLPARSTFYEGGPVEDSDTEAGYTPAISGGGSWIPTQVPGRSSQHVTMPELADDAEHSEETTSIPNPVANDINSNQVGVRPPTAPTYDSELDEAADAANPYVGSHGR